MDNKDYGINLKLNISDFKSKMQEVKNMTKEYLSNQAKEIVAKPEVDTSQVEEAQSKVSRAIENIQKKFQEMSTGKKVVLAVGLITLARNINAIKRASEKAKLAVNKLKDSFNKLGQRITQNVNKGFSSLKRFALRLFGLQAIYRGLQKAVSAYLSYDSELSQNIQNTWAGLGSFLAPILEYLVNAFQRLLVYANAVMKALTGINFVARANAKAMQKTAGATANANKQLAKFDEIENLDKNAGSGANVPQIEMPDVDTSDIEDFASRLRDLFQRGDYFEIGAEIGRKITESLDKVPWNKIQEKAKKIGKGVAQFINGGLSGTDWYKVGNSIAQGLNTALYLVGSFVETFDWSQFGTSLGQKINGFFDNVDWSYAGQTLSNGIKGAFNFLTEALKEIDWIGLANDLEAFIKNVDWSGVAKAVFESIGTALAGLTLFLGTLISDAFVGIEKYFNKSIEDAGGSVVKGLFNGIIEAFKNIGIWIYDHIFKPFIDGFKKAFEIASPSKVMKRLGVQVIDGLVNGLSAVGKIKNATKNVVNSIIDNLNSGIDKINQKLAIKIGNTSAKVLKKLGLDISAGTYNLVNIPRIPRLSVGTDEVLSEGLAYLHAGEKVVPADVTKGGYTNTNAQTDALLEVLINKVDDLAKRPNVFEVNGRQFAKATINDFKDEERRLGSSNVAIRRS